MTTVDKSLLSFMVGSPQVFIESARTLRDLWSGSYLISWLVAKAMRPILDDASESTFVTPFVDSDKNSLLKAAIGKSSGDSRALLPSIPNKFCAIVPTSNATVLRKSCLNSVNNAWLEICDSVRST